jgi:hypothetical protein
MEKGRPGRGRFDGREYAVVAGVLAVIIGDTYRIWMVKNHGLEYVWLNRYKINDITLQLNLSEARIAIEKHLF